MGPDTTIFHGSGITDFGATLFSRLSGNAGTGLDCGGPCGHNFANEYAALDSSITSNLTSCPGKTPGNETGYYSGPYFPDSFFEWLNGLMDYVESASAQQEKAD